MNLDDCRGKPVVVDTKGPWLYIGFLLEEDETYVILENADAFDVSEVTLTKHEYVLRVKQDGIAANRKKVRILKSQIVAVTLLEDVIDT
jgi:hypothetical protein